MEAVATGERCKKSFEDEEVWGLAKTLKVSPRRLLGWEPAEVTSYEYDEGGRLLCAVTVRESEFRPRDLAMLRSWWREDQVVRGSHGHPLVESMSPDADPARRGRKYGYFVEPPTVDFAAEALSKAQQAYKDANKDFDMSTVRWSVKRKDLN